MNANQEGNQHSNTNISLSLDGAQGSPEYCDAGRQSFVGVKVSSSLGITAWLYANAHQIAVELGLLNGALTVAESPFEH
jgi:hypothetical protein